MNATAAASAGADAATPGPLSPEVVERLTARVVSGGATVEIAAPLTGARLATLPVTAAGDVATAYERARAAQQAWAKVAPAERAQPFIRFHDAILDRRAEILDLLQLETGKARRHALEEVLDAAGCTLYHARRAPGLLRPRRRQ